MVTVKLPLSKEITRDYALLKLLGKGGIGEVYLAEQLHVGRRLVALKVLNHSFAQDPAMLSRFKNEAAIAGRLDHENVSYILGNSDVGKEKVWLIWAAQSVPELEAVKQWLFKTGEVQDADQTAAVRAFLAKHPPAPTIKDAQQTTIKGKGAVLVGLIILEHH